MADWTIGPGDWCHVELLTGDRERAKQFYGAVFGWQLDDLPGADYTMITTSENGIESGLGGLAQVTGLAPAAVNGIVPYIRPGDFDTTLAAIERAGGSVLIPKTDVMGYGWFAHFRDPDGNIVGLWQDAPSGASPEPPDR
jgi:predicted enzyme related to lactoylglutathione lyase